MSPPFPHSHRWLGAPPLDSHSTIITIIITAVIPLLLAPSPENEHFRGRAIYYLYLYSQHVLQYVACSRLSTGTRKLHYTITPKLSGLKRKTVIYYCSQVNRSTEWFFRSQLDLLPHLQWAVLGRYLCVLAILLYLWGHLASALLCVHLASLQQASSGINSWLGRETRASMLNCTKDKWKRTKDKWKHTSAP